MADKLTCSFSCHASNMLVPYPTGCFRISAFSDLEATHANPHTLWLCKVAAAADNPIFHRQIITNHIKSFSTNR